MVVVMVVVVVVMVVVVVVVVIRETMQDYRFPILSSLTKVPQKFQFVSQGS